MCQQIEQTILGILFLTLAVANNFLIFISTYHVYLQVFKNAYVYELGNMNTHTVYVYFHF